MATPTEALSSYDIAGGTGGSGNREDLSDMLWDVSPTDTPFISAAGKTTATATNHEWLTDVLENVAANAAIEGNDFAGTAPAARVRLGNYTQILTKIAQVTGTQEKVMKGGGIKSEMAYQVARRMKAIKRDAEGMCVGAASIASIKVAGSESAARRAGAFVSYMTTNSWASLGTTPTAPTGNGASLGVEGTAPAAITTTVLTDALEKLWINSGGNENILGICGAGVRGTMSTFVGTNQTRYVSTDDRKLVNSIDVYNGDYHTVTITPDRFSDTSLLYLVDPEYVKIADLRGLHSVDIAKLGDSTRKELIWETTLEVCNPLAHYVIAGLLDT